MIKAWLPFKHEGKGDDGGSIGSLLRFAAIAVVVATAIIAIGEASRSRDAGRAGAPPTATATHDPLATELARCRGVTPEQLAIDESCRRVWAENRRRFFVPTAPVAGTTETPRKTQERIPTPVTSLSSEEAR